ncbi:hypothetical protein D3C73_1307880 [compost metagenome]
MFQLGGRLLPSLGIKLGPADRQTLIMSLRNPDPGYLQVLRQDVRVIDLIPIMVLPCDPEHGNNRTIQLR